jgi:hypothetical protein
MLGCISRHVGLMSTTGKTKINPVIFYIVIPSSSSLNLFIVYEVSQSHFYLFPSSIYPDMSKGTEAMPSSISTVSDDGAYVGFVVEVLMAKIPLVYMLSANTCNIYILPWKMYYSFSH